MRTIGFPISKKENEKRRALIPEDIKFIQNKNMVFIEKGYGEVLGYTDKDYINEGIKVAEHEEILNKDIICDPKIGDADYLKDLENNRILFGWIHAVQNRDITDKIIDKKNTAIAWEDMYEDGRHIFWKNNELAGETAVMHALTLFGKAPSEMKAAILGRGNIAMGAYKILTMLGADVKVYNRKMEELFREECSEFDILVNGVLWDINRKDHVIYKEDLKRMKVKSMIIDISCDTNGAIETSRPTSIEKPVYDIDGVMHYVVDHTPSLYYQSVSKALSQEIIKYIDCIIEERERENKILKDAIIIENGTILDKKIKNFQNR